MRAIGDKVWYAKSGSEEKSVLCPECFGKKYLKVILGDDSELLIHCVSCSYRPEYSYEEISTGYVKYYAWSAKPIQLEITGMDIDGLKVEYKSATGHGSYYRLNEDEIFDTEEEAKLRANQLSAEHNQDELDKINRKEKNNRTWAWNVHYHRNCIKRAERDLAYHQSKFLSAKAHLKEDKITSTTHTMNK